MEFLIQRINDSIGIEERLLMESLRRHDSYILCSLEKVRNIPARDMCLLEDFGQRTLPAKCEPLYKPVETEFPVCYANGYRRHVEKNRLAER